MVAVIMVTFIGGVKGAAPKFKCSSRNACPTTRPQSKLLRSRLLASPQTQKSNARGCI